MVVRTEAVIEGEIEEIRREAQAAGRALTEAERERINELVVERAAAFRRWDAQWRQEYVRERRDFWRPLERAKLRAALRPSPIFLALLATASVSGFLLATAPSEAMVRPLTVLFILSAWIASVCIHEFGHAIAAYFGGDRSVIDKDYLSLDPRRYTNPLLSILLPIVFLLMGGLGLPGGAVMVETDRLRSRRWELFVAAAGPLASLVCLILAGVPFLIGAERWISEDNVYLWAALAGLVQLEAIVLIWNLLPIPPLDGFRILAHWLPEETKQRALALGFAPLMIVYLVMAKPSPLTDGFWALADGFVSVFRLPWGYAEYAISLLSLT